MMKILRSTLVLFLLLTLITGFVYPLVVTGMSYAFFPWQARGSLIEEAGKIRGSALIGQSFTSERYFWGRPSATADHPYNAASSGASNRAVAGQAYRQQLAARVRQWRVSHGDAPVPIDLVTSSGSGLDPDISIAAAYYQAARVAGARSLTLQQVQDVIRKVQHKPVMLFFGEPRVNVLALNLALDDRYP